MTAAFFAYKPHELVAFGDAGARTWADLLRDVTLVRDALPARLDAAEAPDHVALVFRTDRYLFAVALLASWAAGYAVALPPNTRRDAVLMVSERSDTAVLLHDTDAGLPLRVQDLLSATPSPRATSELALGPPARQTIATLYTSGSTGAVTPCPKSARQLLGEARTLVETHGFAPGDRFVATVPPGHIYGLLFSVLVPLMAGGAFARETPLHAESVRDLVDKYGAHTLVTVPAHLRLFDVLEPGAFGALQRVIASTAPLPVETVDAFYRKHGVSIDEMFGSSETGGVATRTRPSETRWRPLVGVRVARDEDGCLLVHSPFASPTDASEPIATGDLVELHDDGSFEHRGRGDRVLKIAGQRVSLPELEDWLLKHPEVDDAAICALPTPGLRDYHLFAAIAPACDKAAADGLARRLLAEMSERFQRSTLPRRWELVDALPREANGKLQRSALLRLFGRRHDGTPIVWTLAPGPIRHVTESGVHAYWTRDVQIPEAWGYFDGHFSGYPVLAAAVQLEQLVRPLLDAVVLLEQRAKLGDASVAPLADTDTDTLQKTIKRITRMKFTGRIQPGDVLSVTITEPKLSKDGHTYTRTFEIRTTRELASAGTLHLGARDND